MSEPQPETPAPTGLPAWLQSAEAFGQMIDEHIGNALGRLFDSGKADVTEGGRSGGNPARTKQTELEEIRQETRAEVAKLRDDEARQAADKSLHERIEALEKALKAIPEAVPEEYRKITQRMWGNG